MMSLCARLSLSIGFMLLIGGKNSWTFCQFVAYPWRFFCNWRFLYMFSVLYEIIVVFCCTVVLFISLSEVVDLVAWNFCTRRSFYLSSSVFGRRTLSTSAKVPSAEWRWLNSSINPSRCVLDIDAKRFGKNNKRYWEYLELDFR